DLARVRFSAPEVRNALLLTGRTLFLRHHAELAAQPAPALREADRRLEARVDRVVLRLRDDADVLQGPAEIPAGAADDGVGTDGEEALGHRACPLEDRRRIDVIEVVAEL